MHRHGKTSSGNQRWKCVSCRLTAVRKRPDVHVRHLRHHFLQWITGTQSLAEKASEMKLSRKQLSKYFKAFWAELPACPAKTEPTEVLVLDGVYLSGRTNAVLIARTLSNVHSWAFADRECFAAWNAFLWHLWPPAAVVIDGQKGLQQAILQRFPQAHIQRCLVHVERFVRVCVSRNPKTEAGRQLWRLMRSVWDVECQKDAKVWCQQFASWEALYAGFLAERSRSPETGRWWYTHRKLRSARSHIQKALPYLFTFIEIPGIPRTSNHVEGGVNARLKELIRRHRGLSAERKRAVAAFFLASKMGQNHTQKVT
jgi:hypothetical protein